MTELSAIHHTFVIERSYPAAPDRVFAALSDPAQKQQWFAEGGVHHHTEEFTMDFRVGGIERTRSRFGENSPFPGVPLVSDGIYLDIVPGRRVVIAATMAIGERRISAALATFEIV